MITKIITTVIIQEFKKKNCVNHYELQRSEREYRFPYPWATWPFPPYQTSGWTRSSGTEHLTTPIYSTNSIKGRNINVDLGFRTVYNKTRPDIWKFKLFQAFLHNIHRRQNGSWCKTLAAINESEFTRIYEIEIYKKPHFEQPRPPTKMWIKNLKTKLINKKHNVKYIFIIFFRENRHSFSQKVSKGDCKRNFMWPSVKRWQCPIHNSTLKNIVWSKEKCSNQFSSFFSLILMLKLDEPFSDKQSFDNLSFLSV